MVQVNTMEEWNQAIEHWAVGYRKRIGEVNLYANGYYPPLVDGLIVDEQGINNEVASKDLIRHYCDAIGETNPLFRDENYAKSTRYGAMIAPPRFIDFISPTYGGSGGMEFPQIPGTVPLNAGSDVEWFAPVYMGDRFNMITRITACRETTKPGTEGKRLFILTGEREYYNQNHQLVIRSKSNCIIVFKFIPPSELKEGELSKGLYSEIKRHRFTQKELEEVAQAYRNEYRRGREVLFWEDVEEGEELPKIVKGPSTVEDSLAFFSGTYFFAYQVKDMYLRAHPSQIVPDPDTNALTPPSLIHISDTHARLQGMPYAIVFAGASEGHICELITNWIGDDGFIKKMSCQSRRINIVGDLNWFKGNVERKYIDPDTGEHLVDLKVWGENQDGILFMPGTATVRLLSREV